MSFFGRPSLVSAPRSPGVFARKAHAAWFLAAILICFLATPGISAQISPEIVGRIEGQNFTVEPPAGSSPPEGSAGNILVSGSRVNVRGGQARITLEGGGEIVICGAAQLELLKSRGAVTVALDYGILHLTTARAEQVSIITPFVLATPVSVGGGALDFTMGLEQDGRMCLHAARGALRIQQQLGDQSILVPQLGGLTLSGGQVTSFAGEAPGCACKLDVAKLSPKNSIHTQETMGAVVPSVPRPNAPTPPATAQPSTNIAPPAQPQSHPDTPIFKVYMPPLAYDANSPDAQTEPSPEMFLLVRSVRVRSETVFTGTILPGGIHEPRAASAEGAVASSAPRPKIFARIGNFFRRLFGLGG